MSRAERRALERSGTKHGTLIHHQQTTFQTHSGPLPPAEEFERYAQVLPSSAESIVRMAEKEQEERHLRNRNRDELLKNDATQFWKENSHGQWMGFVISLASIAAATILGIYGQSWASAIVGGGCFVGLATAFLVRQRVPYKPPEADDSKQMVPSSGPHRQ